MFQSNAIPNELEHAAMNAHSRQKSHRTKSAASTTGMELHSSVDDKFSTTFSAAVARLVDELVESELENVCTLVQKTVDCHTALEIEMKEYRDALMERSAELLESALDNRKLFEEGLELIRKLSGYLEGLDETVEQEQHRVRDTRNHVKPSRLKLLQ